MPGTVSFNRKKNRAAGFGNVRLNVATCLLQLGDFNTWIERNLRDVENFSSERFRFVRKRFRCFTPGLRCSFMPAAGAHSFCRLYVANDQWAAQ